MKEEAINAIIRILDGMTLDDAKDVLCTAQRRIERSVKVVSTDAIEYTRPTGVDVLARPLLADSH